MSNFDPAELQLIGPAKDQKPPRQLSTRSKARKRALDILFEAEVRRLSPLEVLIERSQRHQEDAAPPVRLFTQELVHGVVEHLADIDERIQVALAPGWTVLRMPRVDRAAVRIGVFEIDRTDVPDEVAIAEAVALVDELSTDDSPVFVNGLLAKIARMPARSQPPAQDTSADD
ncbi:transcription antitermination factor NusB [Granulicoccus sp. GXG6511]|uniref:transcription antitermination factor NusB n=1 Tax=Granulicoccus sp. GXG6511 TaxID=3381351 RepID=UPI003D7EECBF